MDINAIFRANSYVNKPMTTTQKDNSDLSDTQNNMLENKKTEMSWYLDMIFKDI